MVHLALTLLATSLAFESLAKNPLCAIRAELLVSAVHFLNFTRTQHVLACFLIEGSNLGWVWVGFRSRFSALEAENRSKDDPEVGCSDSLRALLSQLVVIFAFRLFSAIVLGLHINFSRQTLPDRAGSF